MKQIIVLLFVVLLACAEQKRPRVYEIETDERVDQKESTFIQPTTLQPKPSSNKARTTIRLNQNTNPAPVQKAAELQTSMSDITETTTSSSDITGETTPISSDITGKTTTSSSDITGETTTQQREVGIERAEAMVDWIMAKPGRDLSGAAPPRYGFEVGLIIGDGQKFCGGALLNKDWIITAASCVPPKSSIIAAIGLQYRYLNNSRKYNDQIHLVGTRVVHDKYNAGSHQNDIALLKLTRSAEIDGEHITAVRIPTLSEEHLDLTNAQAILLGFGKDSGVPSKVSPVLREGRSIIMSNSLCQLQYLMTTIYDTNVCLSGLQATGFCKGDVGGPLVYYEKDNEPTLIGINSYVGGFGCALTWPVVLTRVSSYLRWIHLVTEIQKKA